MILIMNAASVTDTSAHPTDLLNCVILTIGNARSTMVYLVWLVVDLQESDLLDQDLLSQDLLHQAHLDLDLLHQAHLDLDLLDQVHLDQDLHVHDHLVSDLLAQG